jgi:hypothetical protein
MWQYDYIHLTARFMPELRYFREIWQIFGRATTSRTIAACDLYVSLVLWMALAVKLPKNADLDQPNDQENRKALRRLVAETQQADLCYSMKRHQTQEESIVEVKS